MKTKQFRKNICFLLIVALLFLGMYSNDAQTASAFAHASSGTAASSLRPCGSSAPAQYIFDEENLTQHNCAALLRASSRRTADKAGRSIFPVLSYVEPLPLSNSFICIAAGSEPCQAVRSNTIIISYIHLKDGKKA